MHPATTRTKPTNDAVKSNRPRPATVSTVSIRLETDAHPDGWSLDDPYVETFWLPTIGPTSTVLLRHVARTVPSSAYIRFPARDLSQQLGLRNATGRNSPLVKTLRRLEYFELAVLDTAGADQGSDLAVTIGDLAVTIGVRVPAVPIGRLHQFPEHLRIMHSRAVARHHIAVAKEVAS